MTVKEYPIENVDISELKLDPDNSNRLTAKKKKSLQMLMERYGFLYPITIDMDNNIINGHQRAEAYRQLGCDTIPAFRIDTVPEIYQKKLLRQILNKFHGDPDPEKDVEEIEYVMEDEFGAAVLDEVLGIDAQVLQEMNEGLDEGISEDEDDKADKMRIIKLYFTKIEYPDYKKKFDRLKEDYQVTTETECVKLLLEHKESTI